jgi:hypothetical protein
MYIQVTVHTKTKKEEVLEVKPGYFEIWIREPAERGLANKKVLELIKKHLKFEGQIKIVSGHHHPKKMISIDI